jgi:hypothetical protein
MSADKDMNNVEEEILVAVAAQPSPPLALRYESFVGLLREAYQCPCQRVFSLGVWPLEYYHKAYTKGSTRLSYGVPASTPRHIPTALPKGVGLIELWWEADRTHSYLRNALGELICQGLRR